MAALAQNASFKEGNLRKPSSLAEGDFENHLKDGEPEPHEREGLAQSYAVNARIEPRGQISSLSKQSSWHDTELVFTPKPF